MSRHSYVRFFPSDWIAGTARLPRVMRSVYFDVCLHNWDKGEAMPRAEQAIIFADCPDWKDLVQTLVDSGKLKRTQGGGLYSERALNEARSAIERRSNAVRSGKEGSAKRWGNKDNFGSDPMANQNQNQNQNQKTPSPPFSGGEVAPDLPDGENTEPKRYTAAFENWWGEYPNKTGKGKAALAYEAAFKRLGGAKVGTEKIHGKLLMAIKAQKRVWQRKGVEGRYIPHAATWLTQSRFDDEAVVAAMRRPNGDDRPKSVPEPLTPVGPGQQRACSDCGAPEGYLHRDDCPRRPKPSGWVPGEDG